MNHRDPDGRTDVLLCVLVVCMERLWRMVTDSILGGHLWDKPKTGAKPAYPPALRGLTPSAHHRVTAPTRNFKHRRDIRPPSPPPPPATDLQHFWEYVREVIFVRLCGREAYGKHDGKAHFDAVIEEIEKEQHLKEQYGACVDYVLTRLSSPKYRWRHHYLDFHEFRAMVVMTPKSSPPPSPRGGGGVVLNVLKSMVDDYRERLSQVSDDYNRKEEEIVNEGPQGLGGGGPLERLGGVDDSFRKALEQAQALVNSAAEARRKVGAEDSRDLEARVELRRSGPNVDDIISKRLAPLTAGQKAEVEKIFYSGKASDILVKAYSVDMTRENLRTLKAGVWLNDEVINFFFNLLQTRDDKLREADAKRLKSHYFNSFFLTKLVDEGGYKYANVRRWTRRFDIFKCDKVFFPVNLGNTHWCLAVLYMQQKKIQYYDSMMGAGMKYLTALRRYLEDEYADKKKGTYDTSDWELVPTQRDTPQQQNCCDCGVFATSFAYLISENLPITKIGQSDMPNFRNRMALSIVKLELDLSA